MSQKSSVPQPSVCLTSAEGGQSSVSFGVRPNVMTPFDAIQPLPLFTQLRTCRCTAPTVAMGPTSELLRRKVG